MPWIKTIPYDEAESKLKKIYNRVKGPDNNVDNVLMIHSLRPHSLTGHMHLYKAVLHHSNNSLPKWYLETIGVYVSELNQCKYCVDHHLNGLTRLLENSNKARQILDAAINRDFENVLEKHHISGLDYARKLTETPTKMSEGDVNQLRAAGFTDGEILEINQVTSYFNYVNRTVLGLGVNLDGDVLGLSPNNSADEADWGHQ